MRLGVTWTGKAWQARHGKVGSGMVRHAEACYGALGAGLARCGRLGRDCKRTNS